jgi:hypothetical protein
MIESIVEFIRTHMPGSSGLIWAVIIAFTGTLLVVLGAGYAVLRVPHDYFHNPEARRFWTGSHPILRVFFIALKNLIGVLLFLVGIITVLPGVPGPGALIMLIAILFLDFPGKMRFERWLFGRPMVFSRINRLRQRYGRPPIEIPPAPSTVGAKPEKRSAYE